MHPHEDIAPATTSYCYDGASRLTSTSGAGEIVAGNITYDTYGNATRIGDQTFTYDAADRVTGATAVSTGQAIGYTRDVMNRITSRTATGPESTTTRYGFVSADDSPDFQLDNGGGLAERYVSLPGGVLLSKD